MVIISSAAAEKEICSIILLNILHNRMEREIDALRSTRGELKWAETRQKELLRLGTLVLRKNQAFIRWNVQTERQIEQRRRQLLAIGGQTRRRTQAESNGNDISMS